MDEGSVNFIGLLLSAGSLLIGLWTRAAVAEFRSEMLDRLNDYTRKDDCADHRQQINETIRDRVSRERISDIAARQPRSAA
ncbi:MAG: hypothetical protein IT160_07110 [Bryobacterales bacterium]|nr:hypothetical protein [Bryobacterales bacterium]